MKSRRHIGTYTNTDIGSAKLPYKLANKKFKFTNSSEKISMRSNFNIETQSSGKRTQLSGNISSRNHID